MILVEDFDGGFATLGGELEWDGRLDVEVETFAANARVGLDGDDEDEVAWGSGVWRRFALTGDSDEGAVVDGGGDGDIESLGAVWCHSVDGDASAFDGLFESEREELVDGLAWCVGV